MFHPDEYDLCFSAKFLCEKCKTPLSVEPTGFHEDEVDGDKDILVSPCSKCINKEVESILNAKSIVNWKKKCEGYKKRNSNLREKLTKLAIEYNKIAQPKGSKVGAGRRESDGK